jgi:hypothetical protein
VSWIFVLGTTSLVAYQMLTGRISTNRLLADKVTGAFSPARAQLLVVTLIGAVMYLLQVAEHPTQLPEVSQELLLIVGGSNLTYLGGKYFGGAASAIVATVAQEAKQPALESQERN